MAVAGKVATVPKGNWDESTTYEKLDLVSYQNQLFMARKTTLANRPTLGVTDEFWMFMVDSSGSIATPENAGKVKPDNTTIKIDANGTISTSKENLGLGNVDNTADGNKIVDSSHYVIDGTDESKKISFTVLDDSSIRVNISE